MNNQFKKARLHLTAWYLLILMVVSLVFSMVVYSSLNAELLRNARREQQRLVAEDLKIVLPKPLPDPNQLRPELVNPPLSTTIKQDYENSRNNLILMLVIANSLVLGLSTMSSYYLAGKTLKPIELMLEEQKVFISNASHDLRTPLTTLKTALEVTLKMGPIPYPKIKEILESNLDDVNTLETLTNNLLIIEKYSSSQATEEFSLVQMDKLVEDCINKIKPKASIRNIKIRVNSSPVCVNGSRESLHEMVNNFLDNAIKYNKPSGNVDVSIYSQGSYMILKVKDTGIGINNLEIPKIFNRFYRADKSRNSGITGYGLGLAIASQIVKQHKGEISIDSRVGKGTTFTIKLPAIAS